MPREYSIEYDSYTLYPSVVATGVCNGHATVTGTLSNIENETTTKPRFRAAAVVKTWKSDYSPTVVGDTSFEPAGITATYRPLGPSTLDLFLVNPNYATFNYSFTGVLFNQDLSSVSGTIKSRQTALAYSISEDAAPAIDDMRKHYKLVGSLTYTEPSTNQEVSLDTNYSYGGIFTSDEILLNDNYYSTD